MYIMPFPCHILEVLYNDQLTQGSGPEAYTGASDLAAASRRFMYAGTHFTDLGRTESWVSTLAGKVVTQIFNPRPGRESN